MDSWKIERKFDGYFNSHPINQTYTESQIHNKQQNKQQNKHVHRNSHQYEKGS